MANAVALGIASDGSAIPIRLTPAGLLSVSGGSGSVQGPGNYKGESFVLMGIASDGQITPIAVDSSGNIQTSGSSGGSGTVTSVGLTVPSILSVTGSPVTSSGTLAISLATQSANTIFAGPTSGGVVAPAFRALVGADLPATITKATAFNIAGAASAPALSVTGVPFAGTGTTSFPQLYINDSTATASTTLNTAGTYLGVNGHGTADLANFMLDGASKVKVASTGVITVTDGTRNLSINPNFVSSLPGIGTTTNHSWYFIANGSIFWKVAADAGISAVVDSAYISFGGSRDVILTRDAANTLAQRNGTTAQVFNLYNTYTDASNYERLFMGYSGNVAYLYSTAAGTGAGRALQIGTLGSTSVTFLTANTSRWSIDLNGHFMAATDNTYDIGASGATRPRNVYVSNDLTIGQVIRFSNLSTTSYIGAAGIGAGISYYVSNNAVALMTTTSWNLASTTSVSWSSTSPGGTTDLFLVRDAANTLAQRNGTTAQAFNIYQTYTDASNCALLTMTYNAGGNEWLFMTNQAGTGGVKALTIGTVGNAAIRFRVNNTEAWSISTAGYLLASTDNTYDIGASGATRPRNLYLAGIATLGGVPRFNGTNTTGAGSALLGANSPASTLTAPYTWIQVTTSDGSTAYIPCWK